MYLAYQPIATTIKHDTEQLYLPLGVGMLLLYAALMRILRDSRKLRARAAEKEHLALHDPLTELANRSLFKTRVEQALNRRRRGLNAFAVAFVDLDDFKAVNDSMGHSAGDELLVEVAQRLRQSVRVGDTVARLGGDEFAILLADTTNAADVAEVAERIVRSLQTPVSILGQDVAAQGSVGIVMASGEEAADDLLQHADVAMYTAKAAGKDRYEFFQPQMHAAVLERLQLEADLRQAIQRQEFSIFYQPILELQTGRIAAAEALIRWRHPERGLLGPQAFIAVAEATGLIVPIGELVLETACRQACRWQRQYPSEPPLSISVNISAQQLKDPRLLGSVSRILKESELDPGCLILEITETVWVERSQARLIGVLQELKGLGVRLAMDDFGTGFSSLSYLEYLPIDILKIDKCFVDGINKGSEGSALAAALVKVGEALHLKTVAEGIEQAAQAGQLRALGCSMGQGFLFAQPMTASSMDRLLRRASTGERWLSGELQLGLDVASSARRTALGHGLRVLRGEMVELTLRRRDDGAESWWNRGSYREEVLRALREDDSVRLDGDEVRVCVLADRKGAQRIQSALPDWVIELCSEGGAAL